MATKDFSIFINCFLGDLHGSYKDLEFFSASLWKLGIDFTPSKYIFLGDFVDRGPHSVEVFYYSVDDII